MKKLYTIFILLALPLVSFAQIVISEIMYNPPESGADSLEYIELTNAGSTAVNLAGYKFATGVNYTFGNVNLPAGASVVVAKDSVAIKIVFNITVFQWPQASDALSNNGESISIADPAGNIIDEVIYDDAAPWPVEPDDLGPSLVLCDLAADNSNGASWKAAVNKVGTINNKDIKGSPGASNSISCAVTPSVFIDVKDFSFTPKDITIDPGTTVRWTNKGGNHNVNGSTTAYPNNPASFGNGAASTAAWTYDFTFTQQGLYTYQCDPHAASGMKGTITVGVIKNYPIRTIAQVTSTNPEGKTDSIGTTCEITGTVHGVNQRPGAMQFALIDEGNNGIVVFKANSDFGIQIKEGKKLKVKGIIEQFNGLTEIIPEEVVDLGQGTVVSPKTVTSLAEVDESSLILFKSLDYVDPQEWLGGPTNTTSFNVRVTNGTTEFIMRIDKETDIAKSVAPMALFDLTGILGQRDTEAPFTDGYQILPRFITDIKSITATEDQALAHISVYPNPADDRIFTNTSVDALTLLDLQGRVHAHAFHTNLVEVSQIQSGLYLLKIEDSGQQSIRKIILR